MEGVRRKKKRRGRGRRRGGGKRTVGVVRLDVQVLVTELAKVVLDVVLGFLVAVHDEEVVAVGCPLRKSVPL